MKPFLQAREKRSLTSFKINYEQNDDVGGYKWITEIVFVYMGIKAKKNNATNSSSFFHAVILE